MCQNSGTEKFLATKVYEERMKLTHRDSFDGTALKMRLDDNISQLLDPNHASLSNPRCLPSGKFLHGLEGYTLGASQQVQSRDQQLPRSLQETKTRMNPLLYPNAAGPDGPLVGVLGSNQDGSNLTLKGWPLTGLNQRRSGILQLQQFLSPQQQQQLLIQAQQNLASSSAVDVDNRRLRMLLSNRNTMISKEGQLNSVGEVIPNIGFPMLPRGPRADTDTLIKKIAKLQQQQQSCIQNQQLQQHDLRRQSQSSNLNFHQQEELGTVSAAIDRSVSNSFPGKNQALKNQNGRKRKQPVSFSGPTNSTGTANTGGPSPGSAPSTPSIHTSGDVIPIPSLQQAAISSKPLNGFTSNRTVPLTCPTDQLAEFDGFADDGAMDGKTEPFLTHDDVNPRNPVGCCMNGTKDFTFSEFGFVQASNSKVVCCHFSSDGQLLASGGHDKKVVLWSTDTLKPRSTLEEHSLLITDVRFSPSMRRLATSSFDKTVRVWDADNPGYSLCTFTGHYASVMSVDLHPNKEDLVCSCDGDGEIRYWSINNGSCTRVLMGGTTQMRFQPRLGKYLAVATENIISILDVETQICHQSLLGHTKHVHSICWDPLGDYMASVSEDSVKVWLLGSGRECECIHELTCNGNKFHSCVFHPTYPSVLVIGCYQSLELWDMAENKTMTLSAHEGLITSIAASNVNELVASASHDKFIKLWR